MSQHVPFSVSQLLSPSFRLHCLRSFKQTESMQVGLSRSDRVGSVRPVGRVPLRQVPISQALEISTIWRSEPCQPWSGTYGGATGLPHRESWMPHLGPWCTHRDRFDSADCRLLTPLTAQFKANTRSQQSQFHLRLVAHVLCKTTIAYKVGCSSLASGPRM